MTTHQTTKSVKSYKLNLFPFILAAFLVVLNETILNVALSAIMKSFGIDAHTAQWAISAYLLTMACTIPASGIFLRKFGIRKLYTVAMSLFVLGTLTAALSVNFITLIIARIIQAMGAAVIMPSLMTTVASSVESGRRGFVMGMVSIVIGAAPAIGPTISGLGIHIFGWHGLFWMTLVLAIASLVFGLQSLPKHKPHHKAELDFLSMALSVPAFSGLLLSVNFFESGNSIKGSICIFIGLVSLMLFITRQIQSAKNYRTVYLDLRVFAEAGFSLPLISIGIVSSVLFATLSLTPIFLQNFLGLDSFITGLALLPGGAILALLSPISGKMYDRFGFFKIVTPASIIIILSMILFATASLHSNVIYISIYFAFFHIGLAGLFTPIMTEAISSVQDSIKPDASASFSATQQIFGAAGTSLIIGIMQHANNGKISISGFHTAFYVNVMLAFINLLIVGIMFYMHRRHIYSNQRILFR